MEMKGTKHKQYKQKDVFNFETKCLTEKGLKQ
jgi:hypothetical protein